MRPPWAVLSCPFLPSSSLTFASLSPSTGSALSERRLTMRCSGRRASSRRLQGPQAVPPRLPQASGAPTARHRCSRTLDGTQLELST
jgi:hypothetical protein